MKTTAVATVLVLAGLAAGCAKREQATGREAVLSLATATVERQTAAGRIEIDGVVVGRVEAVVSSRLAASVAQVRAVPGQTVKAGAVLVILEQGEAESALTGARASLESARAALDVAKRNRERYEMLEARGVAAAVELDRTRQEEAAAAAAVAGAQASVRRAETDRSQAVLAAPFDAVVVEKLVSPGDLAAPGRPLVRLASLTGRRVEAAPGEEEAAHLKPGDALEVVLPGGTVTGRLAEIVGAVDPQTRRRTVRVDLPAGVEPAVGSFARLVLSGPAGERLLVSRRAVVARGGLELAWAVGADGRIALRYIRTGAPVGDGKLEVRSGLEAGDRVVLDPPADLESGVRVRS